MQTEMKNKLIIGILCLFSLLSCGSAKKAAQDQPAWLSFTTPAKEAIEVTVDGQTYELTTVKTKVWQVDRNIKKTPQNTVFLQPGHHEVRVVRDGRVVFNSPVMLGIKEHRVIDLEPES